MSTTSSHLERLNATPPPSSAHTRDREAERMTSETPESQVEQFLSQSMGTSATPSKKQKTFSFQTISPDAKEARLQAVLSEYRESRKDTAAANAIMDTKKKGSQSLETEGLLLLWWGRACAHRLTEKLLNLAFGRFTCNRPTVSLSLSRECARSKGGVCAAGRLRNMVWLG